MDCVALFVSLHQQLHSTVVSTSAAKSWTPGRVVLACSFFIRWSKSLWPKLSTKHLSMSNVYVYIYNNNLPLLFLRAIEYGGERRRVTLSQKNQCRARRRPSCPSVQELHNKGQVQIYHYIHKYVCIYIYTLFYYYLQDIHSPRDDRSAFRLRRCSSRLRSRCGECALLGLVSSFCCQAQWKPLFVAVPS